MKQLDLLTGASNKKAPPSVRLHDHDARQRIEEDLDATLFVEAAAGTGKTTALIGRVIALIGSGRATLGASVSEQDEPASDSEQDGRGQLVALTFTDKAAGELKLRLRGEIESARGRQQTTIGRQRFDRALRELEAAQIRRSTLSARTCCASGRWQPALIRCSRPPTRSQPDGCWTMPSVAGSSRCSTILPKA